MPLPSLRPSLLLPLCALSLTACPGALEDPDRFLDASVTCSTAWVETTLFTGTCGGAGCHEATNAGGGLDLVSAGVSARLAGASTCTGHPLSSFMLEKLEPSPPCSGSQMPLGKPALTSAQKTCLSSYLAALSDGGVADAGSGDAGSNRPPNVDPAIIAPSTAIAGGLIHLSINATDPDGDALTYAWAQLTPATKGTFSSTTTSGVDWSSPVTTAPTNTSFSVTVSDGRSTPVTRLVTVSVTISHLTDIYAQIISQKCTGCHGGSGSLTYGGTAASAWTAVVDAGHHRGAACSDAGARAIVVPGDPAHSLLFWKVSGTDGGLPASSCGSQMPLGGAQLPANQRVMIQSWILGGALDD
jgi:hypothetical protein